MALWVQWALPTPHKINFGRRIALDWIGSDIASSGGWQSQIALQIFI